VKKYRESITNLVNKVLPFTDNPNNKKNINKLLNAINKSNSTKYQKMVQKIRKIIELYGTAITSTDVNIINNLNKILNFNPSKFRNFYTGTNTAVFRAYINSLRPNVKITNLNLEGLNRKNNYNTIIGNRLVNAANFGPKNVTNQNYINAFKNLLNKNNINAKFATIANGLNGKKTSQYEKAKVSAKDRLNALNSMMAKVKNFNRLIKNKNGFEKYTRAQLEASFKRVTGKAKAKANAANANVNEARKLIAVAIKLARDYFNKKNMNRINNLQAKINNKSTNANNKAPLKEQLKKLQSERQIKPVLAAIKDAQEKLMLMNNSLRNDSTVDPINSLNGVNKLLNSANVGGMWDFLLRLQKYVNEQKN
jgi:hypothetical protein